MAARDTKNNRIPEWRLQAEVIGGLQALQAEFPAFDYAASLEGLVGHLNSYQATLARATGLQAGEPDLRLYFPNARLEFVELKGRDGRLNDAQKLRIPRLEALGFVVHIVKATTPGEARSAVCAIALKGLTPA